MALTAGDILIATDGTHAETDATLRKHYFAEVSINNATMKALPTTNIALASAPGANKVLILDSCEIYTNWTSAYTGIDSDAQMWIQYVGGATASNMIVNDSGASITHYTHFFSDTPARVFRLFSYMPVDLSGGWDVLDLEMSASPITNAGLELTCSNVADFTGGDALNAAKVFLQYHVISLV